MTGHMRQFLFALVLMAAGCGVALSEVSADTPVAILMSDSLTATTRTLQGARKELRKTAADLSLHSFLVPADGTGGDAVIDSIKALKPRLVLTIGSPATQFAKDHFTDIPVVFSAVKYPVLSGFVQSNESPGGTVTGASLDIPTGVQFKYFRQIVPGLKHIGVLYTSATASLIAPAQTVARDMGLELVAIKIEDSRSIPAALDSLASRVEGIWSVADPVLFEPQTTRYLLLNTLRKGIPFMGFSRYVVESGALFALDFDYKAVGFQAGRIAARVLKGESPKTIPVSSVDVIWFHYNEKTARHINIDMPEDLVAIAKEVYR